MSLRSTKILASGIICVANMTAFNTRIYYHQTLTGKVPEHMPNIVPEFMPDRKNAVIFATHMMPDARIFVERKLIALLS